MARSSAEIIADALAEDDPEDDDLIEGVEAIEEARLAYDDAEEYFDGTRPEFFAADAFRRALARTGTTFRLNYAKTPVETVVERLEINGVVGGDDATHQMLDAFWELYNMDIESTDIHLRACEFGDAPVMVWPREVDADDPDDEPGIDVFYNDPRTVRFVYDDEHPTKVKYVIKYWPYKKIRGKETFRANVYYRDVINRYVTLPGKSGAVKQEWVRFVDEEGEWQLPNPYKRIPWFHFRTARPYGVPEHKEAYGPQDSITKIVITHMNTMDYHSFPQRYALSGKDLDDQDGDGEDFDFDSANDDEPEGSGNATQLRAQPGHMMFLKNVDSVGQFDAAGSDVFLGPLTAYIRAMAQVTRTPVHRFDESGNPPSGQSLKVAEQPFVKKVKYRQMGFGATWADLLGFVVEIIKQHPEIAAILKEAAKNDVGPTDTTPDDENAASAASPARVGVSWANPAAADDQLTWDIAIMKIDAGVPHRQAFLEAGYTRKMLDEWGVPASKWTKVAPAPGTGPAKPPVLGPDGKPIQQLGPDGKPLEVPNEPTQLPGFRVNPIGTPGKLG